MLQLSSREELLANWQDLANHFDSELKVPLDNGSSIILKFTFQSEFGVTEVRIKDRSGSGQKILSTFETRVYTKLAQPLVNFIKISLSPPFARLRIALGEKASIITINSTKYWLKTNIPDFEKVIENVGMKEIRSFSNLHVNSTSAEFLLSTTDFLNKKDQASQLISLHKEFLQLIVEIDR